MLWLYPILFISYLYKYVCVNALNHWCMFFVNMLSREKLDVLVLKTGCFGFCGFANKTR
jgi:hypothetical protein